MQDTGNLKAKERRLPADTTANWSDLIWPTRFGRRGIRLALLAGLAALALVTALWQAGVIGWPRFLDLGLPAELPWWAWPLMLFATSFLLGIVAVIGGIGGGVLYVPIVGGFFPFHLDFVRSAGLMVALAGSLASTPALLRSGMANLRLGMPLGLLSSIGAIFGAMIGLALPGQILQTLLGVTILSVVALIGLSKKAEFPTVPKADALATAFGMNGVYHDLGSDESHEWKVHRTLSGAAWILAIGFMSGLCGLGGGWANVPVLNVLMGAPLKVAVATSNFMLTVSGASAAWVYINEGATLAIITVPSLVGMMLGSMVGVRLLQRMPASTVRQLLIGSLALAGTRTLLKGLAIWP